MRPSRWQASALVVVGVLLAALLVGFACRARSPNPVPPVSEAPAATASPPTPATPPTSPTLEEPGANPKRPPDAPVVVVTEDKPPLAPPPETTVRGTIASSSDRRSLADARVDVLDALGNEWTATTDQSGAFSVVLETDDGEGDRRLHAGAEGFAEREIELAPRDADGTIDAGDLYLDPLCTFRATVRTPGAAPAVGATVRVTREPRETERREAAGNAVTVESVVFEHETDAEGRTARSWLANGEWQIVATSLDGARSAPVVRTAGAGETLDLVLVVGQAFGFDVEVIHANGRRAEGVELALVQRTTNEAPILSSWRTQTDAKGRASFLGVWPGEYGVWGRSGTTWFRLGKASVPSESRRILPMPALATLAVRLVTDTAAAELAGSVIQTRWKGAYALASTTGASTTVEFDAPVGVFLSSLTVDAPGHDPYFGRTSSLRTSVASAPGRTARVDVVLDAATELSGRVTLDGDALAEVDVRATWSVSMGIQRSKTVRTGEDGSYRLVGLAAGWIVIDLSSDDVCLGVATRGHHELGLPSRGSGLSIELAAGVQHTRDLDAHRAAAHRVVGRVTSEGRPLADAAVSCLDRRTLSDDNGQFDLTGVVAYEGLGVVAFAPGHQPALVYVTHVSSGVSRVEIDLLPGTSAQVRGRVVDASDRALRDAVVQLEDRALPKPHRWGHRPAIAVDNEGRFSLSAPGASGRVWMRVVAPGRSPRVMEHDARSGDIEVQLEGTRRVVTGSVRDGRAGDALPGARVRLVSAKGLKPWQIWRAPSIGWAVSDASGQFDVRTSEAGGLWVLAELASHRSVAMHVPSSDTIDLTMDAGLRFAGRVQSEGQPIAGAGVSLTADETFKQSTGVTDAEGRFELVLPDVGLHTLRATSLNDPPDFVAFKKEGVRHGESDRVIDVQRGGTIVGTVRDSAGGAVVGATVRATREDGRRRELRSSTTDERGRFEFHALPGESYEVEVRHAAPAVKVDGRTVRHGPVRLPAAAKGVRVGRSEVTLEVDVGGVIAIRLESRSGAPVSGVVVSLVPIGARGTSMTTRLGAVTDRHGVAVVYGVRPGRYAPVDARRDEAELGNGVALSPAPEVGTPTVIRID